MSDNVIQINEQSFESEVLVSKVPVLVDFRAPWCGPCRILGPVVENLANEYGSNAKFVKINVDENPNLPNMFGIQGIPTVIIFKDGKMVGTPMVGVKPIDEYKKVLDSLIELGASCELKPEVFTVNGIDQLNQILATPKYVLLDFWAPWCGPCRMLGPVLEKLSQELSDKLIVVKANVDEEANAVLAQNFGVSGIPHVVLFKDGAEIDNFVGALSYDHVLDFLRNHIK